MNNDVSKRKDQGPTLRDLLFSFGLFTQKFAMSGQYNR